MARPEKRREGDTTVSNRLSRARILVVEDQEDVRGLLVTALAIEGHDVDEASNAREGLRRLQDRRYDLVLSDYAMPGGTGTWMLHEAERAGLMANTASLIVTAHPDARELSTRDVIAKPLDLDFFLDRVRRVLRDSKPLDLAREHMSALKKLETGVPGLDILTLGGIPEGRSTLIAGKSGTGKTVIALQIASNLAKQGIPTIVLAVEESPEDMQDSGDGLGLGVTRLVRDGTLHFANINRPMDGPTIVSGDYDLFGLVHRIEAMTKQTGARAVILDSATALFSPRPSPEALRSHFFQLVHSLRSLGLTAVILAEAPGDYGQLTTMGVEDYVCDLTLILRNIIDGGRRRRSIEVNKYRRSGHYKGEYPCTVTTRGIAVFPLDAKELPSVANVERYSSGVEGLDAMTHGGWLRNSIIIVRGPTGSGKTMLSGLFARAGASRGERVVYYGFEETRPILLRNYREIGMPMDQYIESGNLRVICRYPEATSLEDLLVDLRLGLEELKPSLIVLDSISSIEHASSEKGFRQFMIGVASILREHGRSALITQTTTGAPEDHTAPYLSTIADSILMLDYTLHAYELDRTMRLIKMRGSAHETHPYRLSIGAGGLEVKKLSPEEAAKLSIGRR